MAAAHVTAVSILFVIGSILFVIGRIAFATLPQRWAKLWLSCCVLVHLLVPELIMKGREGLNLANSKELFIGTMNVTNFNQMLDSSYW